MQREERPRQLPETTPETLEFPVGISASRSIRDYETPSAMHALFSESLSSPRRDGAGFLSHSIGVRWHAVLDLEAEV
jgi:hypothetical protein